MKTLRFRLHENFGPGNDVCEWSRVDGEGRLIDQGQHAPRDWPEVEAHVGVVCAGRARVMRIAVPDLPPAKFEAALAFAVEARIAGDLEQQRIVAGARGADGKRPVIVLERIWIETALAALGAAGINVAKLVAECELPLLPSNAWWWNADAQHGFMLTGDDSFALEPARDWRAPPPALQLAVERAGAARPDRLVINADGIDAEHRNDLQALLGMAIELVPAWHWARAARERYEAACSLLPATPKKEARTDTAARDWRRAGILVAAAIALHIAFSVGAWARLAWREHRLLAEATAITQDSLRIETQGAASFNAFRNGYAAARHTAGQPAPSDALPMLARASVALATLPPGSLHQARFADGRWTLDLSTPDAATRDRLLASLSASGLNALHAEQAGGLRIAIQVSQP